MRRAFLLACGIGGISLFHSQAFGQANIPGSVAPGRIEKRFETPPLPQSTIEPTVPQIPPSTEESDRIRFVFSGLLLDGVERPADFLPLYSDLLGTEVSLTQIYTLADAITERLKGEGSPTANATVPPQKITGGIVQIRVVRGMNRGW